MSDTTSPSSFRGFVLAGTFVVHPANTYLCLSCRLEPPIIGRRNPPIDPVHTRSARRASPGLRVKSWEVSHRKVLQAESLFLFWLDLGGPGAGSFARPRGPASPSVQYNHAPAQLTLHCAACAIVLQ